MLKSVLTYANVAINDISQYIGLPLTTLTQSASKATGFGEITQNKGHYAVQGHRFGNNRKPIWHMRLTISD